MAPAQTRSTFPIRALVILALVWLIAGDIPTARAQCDDSGIRFITYIHNLNRSNAERACRARNYRLPSLRTPAQRRDFQRRLQLDNRQINDLSSLGGIRSRHCEDGTFKITICSATYTFGGCTNTAGMVMCV